VIGDNVFVGNNVKILKGSKIGHNSVVGNGSLVTKAFPENVILAGFPAKIIRSL
jgi:maltose O-acetyltransferase